MKLINQFVMSLLVLVMVASAHGQAQPIPVQLKQNADGGWQLYRGGKPYYVKGVGGQGNLDLLVASGANSHRTWGVDDLQETIKTLDAAHAKGLSVAVGIWLGHQRHGFDYQKFDDVAGQIDATMKAVRALKNHPAVLVWGLGNEMENVDKADNPAIWHHIEHLAQLVKKEDPNHPTMTVVAEIGGRKLEAISKLVPSIDILGINSYGIAPTLPARYKEKGGTKPYIVTEFGPAGSWEIKRNNLKTVVEETSTAKAQQYRKSYETFRADAKMCLGSYAFLWGNKQEATVTWFGMLLPDGTKLAPVDTMTELWTGKAPADRCPEIRFLKLMNANEVEQGATVKLELDASDPEGAELDVNWVLMEDAGTYVTGGDFQKTPPTLEKCLVSSDSKSAVFKMPASGGLYRVYAYVFDGKGGAAVHNVPIKVKGPVAVKTGSESKLPFVVFDEDGEDRFFAPSGFMGTTAAIELDPQCTDNPKSGKICMKNTYSRGDAWGGVVWQHPDNDWGDRPGGADLNGAKKLTFWARGSTGGETIKFGFGILGKDKKYFDTAKAEKEFKLEKEWKQFTIDVTGKDMKRIKTGFFWSLAGQGKPLTFYLDRIAFE